MVKIDNNRTVYEKAKITTNNKPTSFLYELPFEDYQAIKVSLVSTLCYNINPNSIEFEDAIIKGMNGRICDLEDTIDIEYIR